MAAATHTGDGADNLTDEIIHYCCVTVQDEEMPLVHVGVFIEKATPFLEEFLERLTVMSYPTARLRLFIHNNVGGDAPAASVPAALSDPLTRSHRWFTTSATSTGSGSATAPSSWTPSWSDLRRTCRRARPETWRRKWR